MTPHDFDWGTGEVTYWALDTVRTDVPIRDQLDELKEDLVQVRFGERILLDVGWYPEFQADGAFLVVVVRDEDWNDPLFKRQASSFEELRAAINLAVGTASR
jgi:hypothetical protein